MAFARASSACRGPVTATVLGVGMSMDQNSDRRDPAAGPLRLVVVGNGMVGQKLLQALVDAGATTEVAVTVLGEEIRPAYDRVGLTSWFKTRNADDLALTSEAWFADHGITLHLADAVAGIDRDTATVTT